MTVELDKLDIHNRQQLSALMDGELSPDEARFLLRRLQHDEELGATWERWQLCGDVLRGQAQAPAPTGFAARVAQAVAAESQRHVANEASPASRGRLMRWGGGALAASVAFVALFMARQSVPQDEPTTQLPAVATTQPVTPIEDTTVADAGGTAADAANAEQALASAAGATVAVASASRRDASARRGATRTQQAARASAARTLREPQRAVAQAAAPVAVPINAVAANVGKPPSLATSANPFSPHTAPTPQSRPWPRSVLRPYATSASGGLTTGYSTDSGARTFYPFDPSLPAQAAQP